MSPATRSVQTSDWASPGQAVAWREAGLTCGEQGQRQSSGVTGPRDPHLLRSPFVPPSRPTGPACGRSSARWAVPIPKRRPESGYDSSVSKATITCRWRSPLARWWAMRGCKTTDRTFAEACAPHGCTISTLRQHGVAADSVGGCSRRHGRGVPGIRSGGCNGGPAWRPYRSTSGLALPATRSRTWNSIRSMRLNLHT